ncbi:MAG TPA: nitrite reductase large subunit NirB [Mycobacteriales bacterium]|nr:nitrite reductase large subunit NirB [Mycobacteriales bacterium]
MGEALPRGDRILVIGYGMVAHRLLQALAARGITQRNDVVVIGGETRPAYDRVQLSSAFAGASADELTLDAATYRSRRVRIALGDPVVVLDPAAKVVRTRSGRVVSYDVCVLATGADPWLPPVSGIDLLGTHTYRTLDDLESIAHWARARPDRPGVVVGGGLLGLEAANALRLLGLDTHVVEVAPHLLPAQLDVGGGAVLRRQIQALGLTLHLGTSIESIAPGDDGAVDVVRLADGTTLDAGTVVVSAGVRPADALARPAGLEIGERGGIVTDNGCRTSDRDIYAIGDVACAGGRCYGLVAPGYEMAEVVAARLAGDEVTFDGADTSTTLKLLGVDVASVGDAHASTPDSLELVYADPVAGRYAKLVTSGDGRQVLGAVLVGDIGQYGVIRALATSGGTLSGPPEDLVLPAGRGAAADVVLPDVAGLCTCNNVSVGAVRAAVRDGEADSVAGLKTCTNAGTTCGSCVPLLKKVLDVELAASGREVSSAMCEHIPVSRQEIYSLIRLRGWSTYTEVVESIGTGRGCDICKPAIASILATTAPAHALEGENAALQDTNDHFLANMQRDGTYSVVPRLPGGEVTPEKLRAIAGVADDFGLYMKITGAQRIDLFGAQLDELPSIWRRLVDAGLESGHAYGKALRTVKSCVGDTWCRFGVQDSVGLAVALELRYRGLRAPHKLKSAVSGCARECAEAQGKDFGIVATEKGWNLYVGGNGGFKPRHAQLLATDLDTDTLVRYCDRFLMFYIRTADRLQRTAPWLESLDGGLDYLKSVVIDDRLGIAAELEADMACHIATYSDEWADVLDDPLKLRRFAAFVNAPDVTAANAPVGVQ